MPPGQKSEVTEIVHSNGSVAIPNPIFIRELTVKPPSDHHNYNSLQGRAEPVDAWIAS